MVTKCILLRDIPLLFTVLCSLFISVHSVGPIIYAVNCGGEAHTDVSGIRYDRDPLHGKTGIASDYGKRLIIGRVHPDDNILYQTERYHTNTFGYEMPITTDGEYVLVLKFSEVYFNAPNQKVFDVVLNGDHTIVSELDIFDKVGRGVAHDEYLPFKITKGFVSELFHFSLTIKLYLNLQESCLLMVKNRRFAAVKLEWSSSKVTRTIPK